MNFRKANQLSCLANMSINLLNTNRKLKTRSNIDFFKQQQKKKNSQKSSFNLFQYIITLIENTNKEKVISQFGFTKQ